MIPVELRFSLSNAVVELSSYEQLQRMRWQWHFDKITILADIRATLRDINEDGRADHEELTKWCWKTGIWSGDLSAIKEYMLEYRRLEPQTVLANPTLQELESEADRWEGAVLEFERGCP